MHALDIVLVALEGMKQMHPENVFIDEIINHIFERQQGVDVFCVRAVVVGDAVVARSNAARAVTADVVSLLWTGFLLQQSFEVLRVRASVVYGDGVDSLFRKLEGFGATLLVSGIIHFFQTVALSVVLDNTWINSVAIALATGALQPWTSSRGCLLRLWWLEGSRCGFWSACSCCSARTKRLLLASGSIAKWSLCCVLGSPRERVGAAGLIAELVTELIALKEPTVVEAIEDQVEGDGDVRRFTSQYVFDQKCAFAIFQKCFCNYLPGGAIYHRRLL
jgi:hypothetical protein